MKILRYYFSIIAMMFAVVAVAQQTNRDYIRMGNRFFRQGDMNKAITFYQKALDKKKSVEAYYNLGCAAALMHQDSLSLDAFREADSVTLSSPMKRAMIYHNMGNLWYSNALSRLRSNDKNTPGYLQNAVNLYRSALRCNPNDNQTRYNLAMAQWLLKSMGGGGKDNDKNKQDQDKKDDDKQQQQQQQQQDQDKKDEQQQKQKKEEQKKDEMSDEVAEQLLKSSQQNEKDVQRKVKMQQSRRRSLEKDW
jgi:Ca-activated chloride channel family protein